MAEKQGTFDRVVEILKDREGLEGVELTSETKLADVGLDSLATVEAVMACEDEFGIEIEADATPQTVGEFVTIVDELLDAE